MPNKRSSGLEAEMKIRKATYRDNPRQAWLSIEDEDGVYLGTLHITNGDLVNRLRQEKGTMRLKFVVS